MPHDLCVQKKAEKITLTRYRRITFGFRLSPIRIWIALCLFWISECAPVVIIVESYFLWCRFNTHLKVLRVCDFMPKETREFGIFKSDTSFDCNQLLLRFFMFQSEKKILCHREIIKVANFIWIIRRPAGAGIDYWIWLKLLSFFFLKWKRQKPIWKWRKNLIQIYSKCKSALFTLSSPDNVYKWFLPCLQSELLFQLNKKKQIEQLLAHAIKTENWQSKRLFAFMFFSFIWREHDSRSPFKNSTFLSVVSRSLSFYFYFFGNLHFYFTFTYQF